MCITIRLSFTIPVFSRILEPTQGRRKSTTPCLYCFPDLILVSQARPHRVGDVLVTPTVICIAISVAAVIRIPMVLTPPPPIPQRK
ncbi:hypothetical protein BDV11DRAFT_65481 [Aspergillus similis]